MEEKLKRQQEIKREMFEKKTLLVINSDLSDREKDKIKQELELLKQEFTDLEFEIKKEGINNDKYKRR